MNWQRHQLVWLSPGGWQTVLAGSADEPPWTDQARDCLQHWAAHSLPLVVTRQADASTGGGAALARPQAALKSPMPPSTWTLGLAAPLRWNRQRLFLRVDAAAVQRVGAFPLAADIANVLPAAARDDWRTLCTALNAAGLAARVYGSHGWQVMSDLPCVREGQSDIDLLLPCATAAQADAAVAVLAQAARTLPRIDGECMFPDGAAVAWREWAAWRAGAVRQVLVKRLHGAALENAGAAAKALRTPAPPDAHARRLGRAAVVALYDELALAPKPGLVSFEDTGSHDDMAAHTFLRSLFALRHSYPRFAMLGAHGADFAALAREGQAAEARMLAATGGVNTHRGAIFTLGLLCASAGALQATGRPLLPVALRRELLTRWGAALAARGALLADGGGDGGPAAAVSHGGQAARAHGLRGANAEAAAGMPVLFDGALPALRQALAAGLPAPAARLQAFFATLAVLDDTNLAHRGGLAGLRWAQAQARGWLAEGGAHAPDAAAHAQRIHRAFVQRRLSPGGSADVLAAASWLQCVCEPA